MAESITIDKSEIFDLVCCAEDYGFNDSVLLYAFYRWCSPITDLDISEFVTEYYGFEEADEQGYTEEDIDILTQRLKDWRDRYQ